MSREPDKTLDVLREIWSAQGQTSADLDDASSTKKSCKRMENVGFGELAEDDGDIRAAWRARLDREGKLNPAVGSIADLVLGPAPAVTPAPAPTGPTGPTGPADPRR